MKIINRFSRQFLRLVCLPILVASTLVGGVLAVTNFHAIVLVESADINSVISSNLERNLVPRKATDSDTYELDIGSNNEKVVVKFGDLLTTVPTTGADSNALAGELLKSIGISLTLKTSGATAHYRIVRKLEAGVIKYQVLTGTTASRPYNDLTTAPDLSSGARYNLIAKHPELSSSIWGSEMNVFSDWQAFTATATPTSESSLVLASILAGEQGTNDKTIATPANIVVNDQENHDSTELHAIIMKAFAKKDLAKMLTTAPGDHAPKIEFSNILIPTKSAAANDGSFEVAIGIKLLTLTTGSTGPTGSNYYQVIQRTSPSGVTSYTVIDADEDAWNTETIPDWTFDNSDGFSVDFLTPPVAAISLKSLFIPATGAQGFTFDSLSNSFAIQLMELITTRFATTPRPSTHPLTPHGGIVTPVLLPTSTSGNIVYQLTTIANQRLQIEFGSLNLLTGELDTLPVKITKLATADGDVDTVAYFQIGRDFSSNVLQYQIYDGSAADTSYTELPIRLDRSAPTIKLHSDISSDIKTKLGLDDDSIASASALFASGSFKLALLSMLLGKQAGTNSALGTSAETIGIADAQTLFTLIETTFVKLDLAKWIEFSEVIINGKDASASVDQIALGLKISSSGGVEAVTDYFQIIKQFDADNGIATYTIIDATAADAGTTWNTDTIQTWSSHPVEFNATLVAKTITILRLASVFNAPLGSSADATSITNRHVTQLWDLIVDQFSKLLKNGVGNFSPASTVVNYRVATSPVLDFALTSSASATESQAQLFLIATVTAFTTIALSGLIIAILTGAAIRNCKKDKKNSKTTIKL